MKIALLGATGNMGKQVLKEVMKLENIECKLLVLPNDKRVKEIKKTYKSQMNRIEIIYGNIADKSACDKVVDGTSYVVNMAAVIPPHSDQYPQKAIECNEVGVNSLVSVIEGMKHQPKLIHISTIALYGNRNERHPWARVGDPLLISPFDIYSITKLRGEFRVLESNIINRVVLRQTAMLHENMLKDNMSDGLMFHTCFNAPLEWVTAEDSGLLIANIIKRDMQEDLSKVFWGKVFNIGGGIKNCVTGYDVLNDGFAIIGGSVKDFFEPNYNATRNFHGVWFYDSHVLDDMFNYQRQTTDDFWTKFKDTHKILKLGKIVPKKLIKSFAIKRLFKNYNSPAYWIKHDHTKVYAYFGGTNKYNAIAKDWKDFNLLNENRGMYGGFLDYKKLKIRQSARLIDLGFNPSEPVDLKVLDNIAKAHGGKLISKRGDVEDKLEWENSDGERFTARGSSVLAGHWMNPCYKGDYCWDFDRLAKKDKVYAALWYDSHDTSENRYYYYDNEFVARQKGIQ